VTGFTGWEKAVFSVILSEAKNPSSIQLQESKEREILRFAQNDRILSFSAGCSACAVRTCVCVLKCDATNNLSGFAIAAEAIEERCVQPLADIFGEGNGFRVAKNLDGLAGGVYDDSAIRAAGKVEFEIGSHLGVEHAVEITRQF
jgi:hypothetical protein